jgi:hypothetical protein
VHEVSTETVSKLVILGRCHVTCHVLYRFSTGSILHMVYDLHVLRNQYQHGACNVDAIERFKPDVARVLPCCMHVCMPVCYAEQHLDMLDGL